MSKTVEVNCGRCGKIFTARVVDRKRGWAKFCSKSCKASAQESRTGQHYKYQEYLEHQEEGWL